MKRISTYLLMAIISISLFSCEDEDRMSTDLIVVPATASSDGVETVKKSILTFESDTLDFGTIAAGKRIEHSFAFTNTGDAPLLISNVHAPCGCTVPQNWPKDAIEVGGTGTIDVVFNSTDRQGHQVKNIDIVTNARPSIQTLYMIGDVIGPEFTTEDIK